MTVLPTARIVQGDARHLPIADGSVHAVVTSPPYMGLRDYGTARWEGGEPGCDHVRDATKTKTFGNPAFNENRPSRENTKTDGYYYRDTCGKCGARRIDRQLGLEPDPASYVAAMVGVFDEVWRVLRDDGTCWIVIGDSYAGGKTGRDDAGKDIGGRGGNKLGSGNPGNGKPRPVPSGLKPKDLIGIPWMLAFALQARGWYLRAEIIWHKQNPMPESVVDRPTKAHEQVFLLAKKPRYFYDCEAVRESLSEVSMAQISQAANGDIREGLRNKAIIPGQAIHTGGLAGVGGGSRGQAMNPAGRNMRSVWSIASTPFPGSHFATFPIELAARCIKASTSERGVCGRCGAPWRRVVERGELVSSDGRSGSCGIADQNGVGNSVSRAKEATRSAHSYYAMGRRETTHCGWQPTCPCGADSPVVPATVFDPFCGAATTLLAARQLGRHGIGVELNPEYIDLSLARLRQHTSGRPDGPRVKPLDGQGSLFDLVEGD